jgi:hypothetical protein
LGSLTEPLKEPQQAIIMGDNAAPVAGLTDPAEWVFAFVALILLGGHLLFKGSARHKRVRLLIALLLLLAPLIVIALASARPLVRFSTIVTCVFVYAVSLFVVLSEALTLFGGAAALTRWRGEKWVKELDYVYFAFGSLGAVMAVNRMNAVAEKLMLPDLYVPVILATALVTRVIKTRAEVNEWQKLKFREGVPSR